MTQRFPRSSLPWLVAAAMIVGFPDINEAIRDLNGRLLPFGWLKLLWRLKVRFPKKTRVALMGVRKEFQKSLPLIRDGYSGHLQDPSVSHPGACTTMWHEPCTREN